MKKLTILIFLFFIIFTFTSCNKANIKITYASNDFGYEYDEYKMYKKGDNLILPELEDKIVTKKEFTLTKDKSSYCLSINEMEVYFNGWVDVVGTEITSNTKANLDMTIRPNLAVINHETKLTMYTMWNTITADANDYDYGIIELPEVEINTELYPTLEHYYFEGWYENIYAGNTYLNKIEEYNFVEGSDNVIYARFSVDPTYVNDEIAKFELNYAFENGQNINQLINLYNQLTASDKLKITNIDKYNEIAATWSSLSNAYSIYVKIKQLPKDADIKASDYEDIKELADKYTELSQDEQEYITNYNDLSTKLEIATTKYEAVVEEVKALEDEMLAIQTGSELYNEAKIVDLYNRVSILDYNALSLMHIDKIKNMFNEITTKKNNNFKRGLFIYGSKYFQTLYKNRDELFTAFFTDFYYFITVKYPNNNLAKNNINSLEDFLACASDYNYGRGQMRAIGDIAGSYLLNRDVNGIIDNQSKDYFIGFCYQNNMYKDLLDFFILFFGYWRIDEKYANIENYGADFFAEAWAPTVDIAKFFYYDEGTTYVKTDRMLDLFNNCTSVYYGDEYGFTTRGYIFKGWYTELEYKNQVTDVRNVEKGTTLYAKYEIDENAKYTFDAAIVDLYIYNLTTKKAVLTKDTVGYVLDMYDKLPSWAQEKVQNYNTLLELKDKADG